MASRRGTGCTRKQVDSRSAEADLSFPLRWWRRSARTGRWPHASTASDLHHRAEAGMGTYRLQGGHLSGPIEQFTGNLSALVEFPSFHV